MKLIAEVDGNFFDENRSGPRRIYINLDEEARLFLIQTLKNMQGTKPGTLMKIMSEEWGHHLSSENHYEGTEVAEILEFTMLDDER